MRHSLYWQLDRRFPARNHHTVCSRLRPYSWYVIGHSGNNPWWKKKLEKSGSFLTQMNKTEYSQIPGTTISSALDHFGFSLASGLLRICCFYSIFSPRSTVFPVSVDTDKQWQMQCHREFSIVTWKKTWRLVIYWTAFSIASHHRLGFRKCAWFRAGKHFYGVSSLCDLAERSYRHPRIGRECMLLSQRLSHLSWSP